MLCVVMKELDQELELAWLFEGVNECSVAVEIQLRVTRDAVLIAEV